MTAMLIGGMYLKSPYRAFLEVQPCKTYIAKTVEITDYVMLQGQVIERRRRELYPKYPSRILSVLVQQGQTVQKGDVLMTLCTEETEQMAAVFYSEMRDQLENLQSSRIRPEVPLVTRQSGLEYAIISPIDGTIMDIYCKTGERTSGIFPCIAVSDLTELAVEAEVSEENSSKMQPGLSCSIEVPAARSISLDGKLSSVAPYAATGSILEQNSTAGVRVEAEILEQVSELRPGYSAQLKILTGLPEMQIILPYSCIGQDDEGEYVFCPDHTQVLVRKAITVGRELREGVEILGGLTPGMVVIEHPENYEAGERVSIE